MVYTFLHKYLVDLSSLLETVRRLRCSSSHGLLAIPRSRYKTEGDKDSAVAPVLWNRLPMDIRSAQSVCFSKTHLYIDLDMLLLICEVFLCVCFVDPLVYVVFCVS